MDYTPLLIVGAFGMLMSLLSSVLGIVLGISKGIVDIDYLKGGVGGNTGGFNIIPGLPTEDCRSRAAKECGSLSTNEYKKCEDTVRIQCIAEGGSWTYRDPNAIDSNGRIKQPWETKSEYVGPCKINTGKFQSGWGHHTCSGKYCDSSTGLCTKLLDGSIPAVENLPKDASCDDLRIVYAKYNDTPRYWDGVAKQRGCSV